MTDEFAGYRARIMAAETNGDPAVFEELLADDAVIQAPGFPVLEGREACLAFVREVLAGLHALYVREVLCESAELIVHGDVAIDRGRFSQTLTPRDATDSSEAAHEEGHYLWIYRRAQGGPWRLSRVVGSVEPSVSFTPIGVVRSPYDDRSAIPKGPGAQHVAEGVIEIRPQLEAGLTDIDGFSHLYVIWQFDRDDESALELMAQPPTADRPHGVFSTRSNRRPNPIGLTVVQLLRRDGRRLYVRGVDMLNGTAVLDIKPSLSSVPAEQLRRGWMDTERGK
jgi:tRNA-Thr(GGU) m(6)t(6)A37 methyltransferase TsaA